MATPPTYAPTGNVIPGSTNRFDGQPADPATCYFRVLIPTPGGTVEQYIRMNDLVAYIVATSKGQ